MGVKIFLTASLSRYRRAKQIKVIWRREGSNWNRQGRLPFGSSSDFPWRDKTMPTDFSSNDTGQINAAPDAQMFAPIPTWERGKKRRSFGARGSAGVAETRSATGTNTTATIAVAAGVVLLGGLAAVGWYATRSHEAGVAQLTPGVTTTTMTTASAPPANDQVAQTAAP